MYHFRAVLVLTLLQEIILQNEEFAVKSALKKIKTCIQQMVNQNCTIVYVIVIVTMFVPTLKDESVINLNIIFLVTLI